MQKISRATDNIWRTAAFDPRKPVSPDWASQEPKPILRSGDEPDVFRGSPDPHHHIGDGMNWTANPPTAEDYSNPESDHYDPYTDPDYHEGGDIPSYREAPPIHDISAMRRHRESIEGEGRMDGSDPSLIVQYHNDSNVNHYYDYDPRSDSHNPWRLTTTHWSLPDAMESRHPNFASAASEAAADKDRIEAHVG